MSFSFGTPSSAPATTGLTSGFSFGANKPSTPGFGLTATSQPSTGLFGTPATSTPAFGAGTATPAFGSTPATGFGASTTPAFGVSSAPAFGATSTPAFGATSTGFGATTTPAFGATTTSTSAFGTGLGSGGLNFGAGSNTAAPTTGLSFGAPATSTGLGAATGLGGFGFGLSTASTAQPGLFGTNTSTANSSLFGAKLGTSTLGSQPAASAAPTLGLGGVSTFAGIGTTNTTASGDSKAEPPKQTKLPNEIQNSVESFKTFVKKQKSISSDIMRVSVKPFHRVSQEAEELVRAAASLAADVSKARAQARRLRALGANALKAAESAGRETSYADMEDSTSLAYVSELMQELEQQLLSFRRKMEVADKQMQAAPRLLTEQELTLGIRRMHESLVALAGRLQAVHSQVEAQKEQYLNLRKYVLKDPTNVFETQSSTSLSQILSEASGKKSRPSGLDDVSSAVLADPKAALGNLQHLAGPTPFTYLGTSSPFPESGGLWQSQTNQSSFGASAFGGLASAEGSFQLQKPPGKRTKQ